MSESKQEAGSLEGGAKRTKTHEEILQELDAAEAGIKRVMEIARDTMQELQQLPDCDYDRVQGLSQEYLETLKEVKDTLMEHSSTLLSPRSNVGVIKPNVAVLKEHELLLQLSKTSK